MNINQHQSHCNRNIHCYWIYLPALFRASSVFNSKNISCISCGITMKSHERREVWNHRSFDCLFNSLRGPTPTKHPRYWPFVWPVNSPHKGPVTQKKLPFDDVIMQFIHVKADQYGDVPALGSPHESVEQVRGLMQYLTWWTPFNTLRPRQNGRHLADDIFKRIFLNESVWLSLKISLKFIPRIRINNIPALV